MENTMYISDEEWNNISEEKRQAIAEAISKERNDDNRYQAIELPNSFYVRFGKRILDVLCSGLACILLFPINLIIAIITFFDVGSPIFFKQERVGWKGQAFYLVKFRNMTNETNEQGVLLPPDKRVTKWGKFVRKTSLDEFLNFWSILKGDMSLIGPRPLPTKYFHRFNSYHQQRHMVRPGLECPFHDKKLAKMGWQGRFDNDVWYVTHLSFKTDMLMAFLLVKKVFSRSEREESASGKTGEFIGYCEDGSIMNEWLIPRKYLAVLDEETKGNTSV